MEEREVVMDIRDYVSTDSSSSDEEEFEEEFEVDFIIHDGENSDREETQPSFGGYEYEFVDEVSDSQKCPVCLLPMRDAVQTSECGHRFCKECLHGILRNNHPVAVCPNDRREIQAEGGYFSDKAWARDILCLRVKCKQTEKGCDWIGQLRHAEDHKDECAYEDEECFACGDNVQRRLLGRHHNDECPKRIVECIHCQDEFTFIEKEQHEDNYCRRFPLVCANSCGHDGIPREEMEWHLSKKCPMTEVTCPYVKAGCPFQDKRAHLNDHIEASVDDHLEMTWSSLDAAKQELNSMKDLRQQFHQMQEENQKLTEIVADSRGEIRELTLAVKNLEMQNIQQQKRFEDMARKMEREIKTVENRIPQDEVSRVGKILEVQKFQQRHFEDMARKMEREIKRVENKIPQDEFSRAVNATKDIQRNCSGSRQTPRMLPYMRWETKGSQQRKLTEDMARKEKTSEANWVTLQASDEGPI